MTNIPADLTMEKLQKTAHPTKHTVVLWDNGIDKKYWQKLWLINRYAEELGFKKSDLP